LESDASYGWPVRVFSSVDFRCESQPGVWLWAHVLYLVLVFVKSVLIYLKLVFPSRGRACAWDCSFSGVNLSGFRNVRLHGDGAHGVFLNYSDSGGTKTKRKKNLPILLNSWNTKITKFIYIFRVRHKCIYELILILCIDFSTSSRGQGALLAVKKINSFIRVLKLYI
jgi:hypothetical protein